ncbi:MAG: hypothetical protein ABJ360_09565 [Roseobacter sp.]
MLEQVYWIAGIVVAAVAVIGLLRWRKNQSTDVNQSATVSGQGNTVNQRMDNKGSESNRD